MRPAAIVKLSEFEAATRRLPSPFRFATTLAIATAPEPPGMLVTYIVLLSAPVFWSTLADVRQIVSQPPPGLAGAIISIGWSGYLLAAPPQALVHPLALRVGHVAEHLAGQPRVYADANVPAGVIAFLRSRLHWDVLAVIEHDDLRRLPDAAHFALAAQLRRTLLTLDRDYLDDRRFPAPGSPGVLVVSAIGVSATGSVTVPNGLSPNGTVVRRKWEALGGCVQGKRPRAIPSHAPAMR